MYINIHKNKQYWLDINYIIETHKKKKINQMS